MDATRDEKSSSPSPVPDAAGIDSAAPRNLILRAGRKDEQRLKLLPAAFTVEANGERDVHLYDNVIACERRGSRLLDLASRIAGVFLVAGLAAIPAALWWKAESMSERDAQLGLRIAGGLFCLPVLMALRKAFRPPGRQVLVAIDNKRWETETFVTIDYRPEERERVEAFVAELERRIRQWRK